MKKLTKWGLMLAASGSMLAATAANAVVILGNTSNVAGDAVAGVSGLSSIAPSQHKGVLFTTSDDYDLTLLTLLLGNFNPDDNFVISLREDGIVGPSIIDFAVSTPTPTGAFNGITTFEFVPEVPFTLAAGTYALDLRELTNGYTWITGDNGAITPSGAGTYVSYLTQAGGPDFGDDGVDSDAPSPVGNTSTDFSGFRLEGDLAAAPVPVPGAALLVGMGLFLVRRKVKA